MATAATPFDDFDTNSQRLAAHEILQQQPRFYLAIHKFHNENRFWKHVGNGKTDEKGLSLQNTSKYHKLRREMQGSYRQDWNILCILFMALPPAFASFHGWGPPCPLAIWRARDQTLLPNPAAEGQGTRSVNSVLWLRGCSGCSHSQMTSDISSDGAASQVGPAFFPWSTWWIRSSRSAVRLSSTESQHLAKSIEHGQWKRMQK